MFLMCNMYVFQIIIGMFLIVIFLPWRFKFKVLLLWIRLLLWYSQIIITNHRCRVNVDTVRMKRFIVVLHAIIQYATGLNVLLQFHLLQVVIARNIQNKLLDVKTAKLSKRKQATPLHQAFPNQSMFYWNVTLFHY